MISNVLNISAVHTVVTITTNVIIEPQEGRISGIGHKIQACHKELDFFSHSNTRVVHVALEFLFQKV